MTEPLQLLEIRKTQRRVAALLQYHDIDIHVPKPSKRKKYQLFQNVDICSHLDPEGKYRRAELDYLHQGIREAKEYYQNISLGDVGTDSGTEAPYNSPEISRLSLKHRSTKTKDKESSIHNGPHWQEETSGGKKMKYKYMRSLADGDHQEPDHNLQEPARKRQSRAKDKTNRAQDSNQNRHTNKVDKNSFGSENSKRSVSLPAAHDRGQQQGGKENQTRVKRRQSSAERTLLPRLRDVANEEDEPHLRYKHGIARKSLPNEDLQLSRDNTHENMVRITGYEGRRASGPFCSCDHPVIKTSTARSPATCGECHSTGKHATWCTAAKVHTCEVCGRKIQASKISGSNTSPKFTSKSKISRNSKRNSLESVAEKYFGDGSVDGETNNGFGRGQKLSQFQKSQVAGSSQHSSDTDDDRSSPMRDGRSRAKKKKVPTATLR